MTIDTRQTIVVFEAVRGGHTIAENRGDICIDNIKIVDENCRMKNLTILFAFLPSLRGEALGEVEGILYQSVYALGRYS